MINFCLGKIVFNMTRKLRIIPLVFVAFLSCSCSLTPVSNISQDTATENTTISNSESEVTTPFISDTSSQEETTEDTTIEETTVDSTSEDTSASDSSVEDETFSIAIYLQIGYLTKSFYQNIEVKSSQTYKQALSFLEDEGYRFVAAWNNTGKSTLIDVESKVVEGVDLWVRVSQIIEISTPDSLIQNLVNLKDNQGLYDLTLVNDISFDEYSVPVEQDIPSCVTLDGKGYSFLNLNLNIGNKITKSLTVGDTTYELFSPFFDVNHGTIQNLTIKDCDIFVSIFGTNNLKQLGGVVARNRGKISNVHIKHSQFDFCLKGLDANGCSYSGGDVGLIAGSNAVGATENTSGIIEDCTVDGDVYFTSKSLITKYGYSAGSAPTADYYSNEGGLVGYNAGKISNCSTKGNLLFCGSYKEPDNAYFEKVTPTYISRCGGLVGSNEVFGDIQDCSFEGIINNQSTYENNGQLHVGGLVGLNVSSHGLNRCEVSNSTLQARVSSPIVGTREDETIRSGNITMGGLVGENRAPITNSVARDMFITCFARDFALSGFVGVNASSIQQCYSQASIQGNQACNEGYIYYAGFVGHALDTSNISNCLAATDICAREYSTGKIGVLGNAYDRFGNKDVEAKFENIKCCSDTLFKFLPPSGAIPKDKSGLDDISYDGDLARKNPLATYYGNYCKDQMGFSDEIFSFDKGRLPRLK